MEPPQAPTEQRRESRVSDLSASDFSDVPDLKRELEKCVHRIIRDGPKRSTEGSTDLRVDLEHYREEIMGIVRKCPHEIVPVDLAEPLFTPLRAEFGGNETLYVCALEEKLREAKKEEDGLKKKNKELTREVKELRKENDEVEKLEDTLKTLMEENGRLREEAEQARKEAKKFERRLLTVEGELIEEKERAGENRKKLDDINDMIAEKRREFEGEKMMFEAERKELEMYRCAKDDPALRALLRGTSMVAGHWIQDTKREGEMVTEILNSRQSIQPHDQENPKTPDQEHAKPLKAMGAIHRSPFSAAGTPGGPDAVVKNGPAGTSLEDELPENWQDEGSQVSMTRPEHWGDGPRADYNVLVVENSRLKEAVAELRKQIQDPQGQIIKGQEDGSVVTSVAFPRLEEIQRLEAEIARLEEVESVDNTANENEGLNTLRECERCGQATRRAEGATQVSPEEVTVISSDGLSEAEDRIRELEDVIISQLDFHRDVKPLLTATDNLTTDAWQARMQEFRENEGQGKERDDVLFGLWGELEGARGRLGEVIGDARERLDEDALRLGIKVRTPFSLTLQNHRD